MSDENKSRRCSFELFPDERTGDKIADELIANEKLKERGRFMRAMLVTGAAFAAIDKTSSFADIGVTDRKYDSG